MNVAATEFGTGGNEAKWTRRLWRPEFLCNHGAC